MRFELVTLVDITQTDARRGEDSFKYNQQQNFLTVLQTISLRANPMLKSKPKLEKQNISNLNFGRKFKGIHNVWTLRFDFESEQQHSIDMLKEDFNLVPFIKNLEETANLDVGAFITNDEQLTNIFFIELDK